jgi:hypothetical protein
MATEQQRLKLAVRACASASGWLGRGEVGEGEEEAPRGVQGGVDR